MSLFQLPPRLSDPEKPPRLLFLTSTGALDQIGWTGLENDLKDALLHHGLVVLPTFMGTFKRRAKDAAANFREQCALLPEGKPFDGVVIIGGYDSVPARRTFTLSEQLQADIDAITNPGSKIDTDRFIVWNDDHFAGFTESGLPDIPISRIPCWDDATVPQVDAPAPQPISCQDFVINSLQTPDTNPNGFPGSFGLRGTEFIFSSYVYQNHVDTSGAAPLSTSPITFQAGTEVRTFEDIRSSYVYFVLHGAETDGTVFIGTSDMVPIMMHDPTSNQRPFPLDPLNPNDTWLSDTIFASCCWGALIAKASAYHTFGTGLFGERHVANSLPIKLLSLGSGGFVGFTGTHHAFSQGDGVDAHFHAEPLHHLFWDFRIISEMRPAEALHEARMAYRNHIPYPSPYDVIQVEIEGELKLTPAEANVYSRAVEFKTFYSPVCFGLGW